MAKETEQLRFPINGMTFAYGWWCAIEGRRPEFKQEPKTVKELLLLWDAVSGYVSCKDCTRRYRKGELI